MRAPRVERPRSCLGSRGLVPVLATVALAVLFVTGSVADAFAQTGYVPYYGKNRIRYDNFKWTIYTTDHFEIYYYPEIEQHLERVTSYAESAYQQVSSDLKHDLAFKVPLVLYKTQAEFQQQNIEPGELPEGVLAFAEPYRDRMVLPIDEPSDALYRLITHELTHIFEFDIIPRSLLRRGLPLWVDEGLSDYMTGYWNPFDLMTVRDAAIADIVPSMSDFEGVQFADGRLPYNLGHAAFEFIESKWGKEGLRQFLFALRKNVIGGGDSAYEEAFRLKPEEFDEQFDKYLKDRFKPFRDKERPADYGKDLAPKRDKTPYVAVVSIEPSPSGDLMAVAAGNRKDQELDIVLLSTKDGKVIRNLTSGFNQNHGYEYIATPGGFRNNAVPWMSWSPAGDRIAYFARTEKQKTLILQNVVTTKIEQRIELKTVDMPESPDISPDGKEVAFSGSSRRDGRHLHRQPRERAGPQPDQRRVRRLRADLRARRQVARSICRASAATTSCSGGTSRRTRRRRSRSARTTTAARSSWTTTRSCSRRPPRTRTSRSTPRSRATATSTTSGRST